MPLANRITPANGDERAQVVPLLDAVKVQTGKRGRPRKRLKVIATDKGYDAKGLRQQLRKRGIRVQIPQRTFHNKLERHVAAGSQFVAHSSQRFGGILATRLQ